jgi:hypothetical protein
MKNIILCSFALLVLTSMQVQAQCIKDVQNLIEMPEPCFFIGMVDYDNPECFDASQSANYKYKWWITAADNGEFIAVYEGFSFQHTFKKFGGYKFCLEIDRDDDPFNAPDVVDCVTYTTCQICTEDRIDIEYVNCPYGGGCDINVISKIHAENVVGLKPTAKIIFSYRPTPQELLGGVEPYDLEYDYIAVDFDANSDSIQIFQSLSAPYKRGCYTPKIVFSLLDGYGAHGMDGVACREIVLESDQIFRCIACGNEDGECRASEVATAISNEDGTCDLFTSCNLLREDEASIDGYSDEHNTQQLRLSPNPTSDNLHIDIPFLKAEDCQILLLNHLGQQVLKLSLPAGEKHTDLDVSQLTSGLYIVAILENGRIAQSSQVMVSNF